MSHNSLPVTIARLHSLFGTTAVEYTTNGSTSPTIVSFVTLCAAPPTERKLRVVARLSWKIRDSFQFFPIQFLLHSIQQPHSSIHSFHNISSFYSPPMGRRGTVRYRTQFAPKNFSLRNSSPGERVKVVLNFTPTQTQLQIHAMYIIRTTGLFLFSYFHAVHLNTNTTAFVLCPTWLFELSSSIHLRVKERFSSYPKRLTLIELAKNRYLQRFPLFIRSTFVNNWLAAC